MRFIKRLGLNKNFFLPSLQQKRNKKRLQYISHSDFHFDVSREKNPGVYEIGVDIGLNEWINLRIEVKNKTGFVPHNDRL
jgi:hypothetical protein